jgi:hypothetical protein
VTAEITDETGNMIDIVEEGTGCTATTRNDFAQGHDAKLKSALIRWGAANYEVAWISGGVRSGSDAMGVATRYGFAHMVADGIAKAVAKREAAQARADHKHERAAAKAAGKAPKAKVSLLKSRPVEDPHVMFPVVDEAPEPLPVPVRSTCKVGRWTYRGTVNLDGSFTYTNKSGEEVTTRAYIVLDA